MQRKVDSLHVHNFHNQQLLRPLRQFLKTEYQEKLRAKACFCAVFFGPKTAKTEIFVKRLGEKVNNNFRPRERYFFVYTFEKNESPGKKKHRIQIYFDEFFYPK